MSYGRHKIFTDAREITLENVVEEVRKAVLIHDSNRNEINKLYDYYRGKTPILGKQKETRPEINHKEMLKIVLRILRDTVGTNLKLTDIMTHFTRRNYENIAAKSQVLISMLNNPKN